MNREKLKEIQQEVLSISELESMYHVRGYFNNLIDALLEPEIVTCNCKVEGVDCKAHKEQQNSRTFDI